MSVTRDCIIMAMTVSKSTTLAAHSPGGMSTIRSVMSLNTHIPGDRVFRTACKEGDFSHAYAIDKRSGLPRKTSDHDRNMLAANSADPNPLNWVAITTGRFKNDPGSCGFFSVAVAARKASRGHKKISCTSSRVHGP